ncbi:glycosyltransferase [Aeromonas veronii]|uniref:glycosyltransferase n=1 Tax=Aeromonas veronii TaxID=654 RepID=UPI000D7649A7
MFSIVIPTYNRKDELMDSLASITELDDCGCAFEVIVVDDCSTQIYDLDLTTFGIDISYIRLAENGGPSVARNSGAMRAKYDWLLFLDDDDRFLASKLVDVKKAITDNPECELFYHLACIDMQNEGFSYQTKQSRFSAFKEIQGIVLDSNPIGGAPNLIISRALFLRAGMFDSQMKAIEDYEFIIRLARFYPETKIFYIEKPLTRCQYVTNKSSVSKSAINTKLACDYVKTKYTLVGDDALRFSVNEQLMCAYAQVMNKSRMAALNYKNAFLLTRKFQYLAISFLCLINPSLLFYVKKIVSSKQGK